MKKLGEAKLGMEGSEEGRWILVDYGDFVIHVFAEDARTYYDLEQIWGDASRVEWRDPARIKAAPPIECRSPEPRNDPVGWVEHRRAHHRIDGGPRRARPTLPHFVLNRLRDRDSIQARSARGQARLASSWKTTDRPDWLRTGKRSVSELAVSDLSPEPNWLRLENAR